MCLLSSPLCPIHCRREAAIGSLSFAAVVALVGGCFFVVPSRPSSAGLSLALDKARHDVLDLLVRQAYTTH